MAGESGLVPGATLAGYRLESRVGAGGTAVVFRARDEQLDRTVALKVLTPELGADTEFRERFIRESRAAAAVDHPHIIPVYAAGEADGRLYIAMRFVAGGDLHSVLDREGPLPARRTAAFISPVASALDAAHGARLVHRDVKPANILVDMSPGRPDHPYLSDFGLSKDTLSSVTLTGTGSFMGTPDFCAPEQISGKAANVRTDQYALACVAYTLLTGATPFIRDEPMAVLWAHMSDPPPSATRLRPDLPAAVDQVLARAMAKSPQDRFDSCGEFADSLRVALGLRSYTAPTGSAAAAVLAPPTEELAAMPSPTARFTPRQSQTAPMTASARVTPSVPFTAAAPPEAEQRRPEQRRAERPRGRRVMLAAAASVLVAAVAVTATILATRSGPTGSAGAAAGTGPTGPTGPTRPTGPTGGTGSTGAAAAWQAGTTVDAGAHLTSVSCPTDGFCVATDTGGNTLSYNGGTWSAPSSIGGAGLAGVSCSSQGFCAAITANGATAYIRSGGAWTGSTLTGADGGPAHLVAVSCPSDGHCFATGGRDAYQYANGTWSHGTRLENGSHHFTSISCPAVAFCVAVDDGGDAYTDSDGTWSAPAGVSGGTGLGGVSCSSQGFCAAVTTNGTTAYMYSGSTWKSSTLTGADGGPAHLTAVSCPGDGRCVATGGHDAYQYVNAAWSRGTHLKDTNLFTSVSCATGSFCAAVDNGGEAYLYR